MLDNLADAGSASPTDAPARLPLRWLFAHRRLRLVPLSGSLRADAAPAYAPGDPADQRMFTQVQVTELRDPSPFLAAESIVLTVGIAFERDPEGLADFVARVADAGAVALGFGTGLIFEAVPASVIEAAEERGIVLFEVPHDTAFLAIQQTVAQEQARQAQREQRMVAERQRAITSAAVSEGVRGVLHRAAGFLQAELTIRDAEGAVIAHSSASAAGAHVTQRRMSGPGDTHHTLLARSATPLDRGQRSVLAYTAMLATVVLQRPVTLRSAQRDLNTLALGALLGAAPAPEQLEPIFMRLADADSEVRMLAIHADHPGAVDRALVAIDDQLAAEDRELCAHRVDPTALLVVVRGRRTVEATVGLLGPASGKIRRRVRVAVSASLPWRELSAEAVAALVSTAQATALGRASGPGEGALQWTRLPQVQEALAARAEETIVRLEQADAAARSGSGAGSGTGGSASAGAGGAGGGQLAATLASYLHHGGHSGNTAAALGVHRHTLRHRLRRIAEICEVDIDDPVTRAELLLIIVSRR